MIKGNRKAIIKEQQLIKDKIDKLFKDIVQYENNMSFLDTNKGTAPLIKQVERKIKQARLEIKKLTQRLQMLI